MTPEIAMFALSPLDRESIVYTLREEASAAGEGTVCDAYEELARIVEASGLVAGKCRVCGCDEAHACEVETEPFGTRPCGWADETQTLCDAPNCLASAAAAKAVDEVMGKEGPGPFPPTYRTEGGSTRPVVHSEEAGIT